MKEHGQDFLLLDKVWFVLRFLYLVRGSEFTHTQCQLILYQISSQTDFS